MGPMGPQGPQEGTGGTPRGPQTPPEARGHPQRSGGHFWKKSLFGLRAYLDVRGPTSTFFGHPDIFRPPRHFLATSTFLGYLDILGVYLDMSDVCDIVGFL